MKILVVDDLKLMRRVIVNALNSIGYDDVFEAKDGLEAIEILEKTPIDLVITDWIMPKLDGLELAKYIKENPAFSNLPVIMLTVKTAKEDIIEAAKANVDAYLAKPFNSNSLKEKIDELINPYKTFTL